MTRLSLAARNYIAQDAALAPLLGKSQSWPIWVFDERPVGIKFEGFQKCLVVINEDSTWTSPNEHNTLRFPRLIVDIWADPTRNEDRSVRMDDARDKIEVIETVLSKHFHTVDMGLPSGKIIQWGTAEEIEANAGVFISGSSRRSGPEFRPVKDNEGAWMGTYIYGVNKL